MNIQYYGDYCFKITTKPFGRATEDVIIWTDPCDSSVGLKSPQGQADVVLLSHRNSVDVEASGLKGDKIIIDGPGEYAVKGINAFAIASYQDTENGSARGQNTIFVLQSEAINICFLGALGHELTPQQIDKIGSVDVLFAPIGNFDTLSAKLVDDLIRKIEPAMVVPMHYKMDGMKTDIDTESIFCNEMGTCPSERVAKLAFKKKDLEGKSMEIVLFERA